jgi:ABC-2 type transport system permease protein
MQGSFKPGGGGREMIASGLEKLGSDQTLDPEIRGQRSRLLQSLDRFMSVLDSTGGSAGASSAPGDPSAAGASAGPNLRIVEIAEEDSGPRSAYEVTFPSSIAWALIGVCMSFAVSIVYERITGTFLRLRLAPIGRAQVLAGKGLAAFLAAPRGRELSSSSSAWRRFTSASRVPPLSRRSPSAFCFTGIMMVVATLGSTPPSVAGAGWAIMMIMSMTGGGMVPLIAMPAWMQRVSDFSLVKYAVLSVEGAIWRGFGWSEMPSCWRSALAGPLAVVIGTRAPRHAITDSRRAPRRSTRRRPASTPRRGCASRRTRRLGRRRTPSASYARPSRYAT